MAITHTFTDQTGTERINAHGILEGMKLQLSFSDAPNAQLVSARVQAVLHWYASPQAFADGFASIGEGLSVNLTIPLNDTASAGSLGQALLKPPAEMPAAVAAAIIVPVEAAVMAIYFPPSDEG